MKQDLEQLKLLAIFHYVVAGMAAMVACIPFLHLGSGPRHRRARRFGSGGTAGRSSHHGLRSVIHRRGLDIGRTCGLRREEPADAPALHLLSGHGRHRVHLHAGWHGARRLHHHRSRTGFGERAVRTPGQIVLNLCQIPCPTRAAVCAAAHPSASPPRRQGHQGNFLCSRRGYSPIRTFTEHRFKSFR